MSGTTMSEVKSTETVTAYKKAWEAFRGNDPESFDLFSLTPGPYLENRLHRAFDAGWNAALELQTALERVGEKP